jgi:hypothetical protein
MVSLSLTAGGFPLIGSRRAQKLKYKDYAEFLNKFEGRFGTKPKKIGLPTVEFKELEKDLEEQAPIPYTADYKDGERLFLLGVEIVNSGGNNGANVQFHTA